MQKATKYYKKEKMDMEKIKPVKKARIGVYTMGLKTYWNQFAGLRERMIEYGQFIADRIAQMEQAEVYFTVW